MLVYHPALDLYNCIFRMLQLLAYAKEPKIPFEKFRIWDFYLAFPGQVRGISFPAEFRELKEKVFKSAPVNPYEEISDPIRIFEMMRNYQLSATKCLASYGFLVSEELSRNLITRTEKKIPSELNDLVYSAPIEKANVIKLVTRDFIELPLYGNKGLKSRTGLLDFKYDPK